MKRTNLTCFCHRVFIFWSYSVRTLIFNGISLSLPVSHLNNFVTSEFVVSIRVGRVLCRGDYYFK